MNLLSFDAVTSSLSIAVIRGEELAYEKTWSVHRSHSTQLPPGVEEALRVTKVPARDLDAIVVTSGPGSYTGIRIALAFAKGMAMSLNCPLIGISTLEVVAYSCGAYDGPVCALMTLGPGRIGVGTFCGPWPSWRRMSPDVALPADEVRQAIPSGAMLCGSGASGFALSEDRAPGHHNVPRAANLAHLGIHYLLSDSGVQIHGVEPNYLRPSAPEIRAQMTEAPN